MTTQSDQSNTYSCSSPNGIAFYIEVYHVYIAYCPMHTAVFGDILDSSASLDNHMFHKTDYLPCVKAVQIKNEIQKEHDD